MRSPDAKISLPRISENFSKSIGKYIFRVLIDRYTYHAIAVIIYSEIHYKQITTKTKYLLFSVLAK